MSYRNFVRVRSSPLDIVTRKRHTHVNIFYFAPRALSLDQISDDRRFTDYEAPQIDENGVEIDNATNMRFMTAQMTRVYRDYKTGTRHAPTSAWPCAQTSVWRQEPAPDPFREPSFYR